MAELTLVIPIVVGLVVGLLEAYFVYSDENMTSGKDFLGDMWHGLLFAAIGVVAASNVPLVVSLIPEGFHWLLFVTESGNSWTLSIVITIFMLMKMVASHAVKGVSNNGFQEKFWHKLVVALLVGFAPFYIELFVPLIPEAIIGIFPEWFPL